LKFVELNECTFGFLNVVVFYYKVELFINYLHPQKNGFQLLFKSVLNSNDLLSNFVSFVIVFIFVSNCNCKLTDTYIDIDTIST